MKTVLITFMAATALVAAPASAAPGQMEMPVPTVNEQVAAVAAPNPGDYLSNVNATPLSPTDMESIRGQGLPRSVVRAAVRLVGNTLGGTAALKLEALLSGSSAPSYAQYRKAFGTKTAIVLSLLPAILKPNIAQ